MSVTIKRGDTLEIAVSVSTNGNVQPLTGWTIKSQIRRRGGDLLRAFDIVDVDLATGQFALRVDADETELWQTDLYKCDIELTDAEGFVVSSDTFNINVTSDVTRD
jgi:hypothetical protein